MELVGLVTLVLHAMLATRGGGNLWPLPLGLPMQHGDRSQDEGHRLAEGELTSEVSCWLFPCPGLPHHRCLPDPTESQGTPRLKVAWQQEAQVWERSHHRSVSWLLEHRDACGIPARGGAPGLLTWLRPPRPLPQGHTVPRSFLTTKPWLPLCSAALGPFPSQLSKAGASEVVSWAWADGGAGAGRGPSCLCAAAPSGSARGRCSADEPETTSGGWCLGFSVGTVTLREPRSCQAQATPSASLTECVSVSVFSVYQCGCAGEGF